MTQLMEFSENKIIIKGDYAEVVLYNRRNEEVSRALIDIEDIPRIKKNKWGLSNTGYASYSNSKKMVLMHRTIIDCPKDMEVDHISHNKLDNRKNNLRICTRQENCFNQGLQRNNTSGYTGVNWNKQRKKWVSSIMFNKKTIHLGYFANKNNAINARKEAELKYFGKFRPKDIDNIGKTLKRTRGFEAVTGFSPELPKRATAGSAGYDIKLIEDLYLAIGETVVVPTGLKVYMQADEVLKIYIRSSMGTKHKLSLANSTGVIDADFFNNEDNEGHFVLAIVNNSGEPKYFPKGTKVAQGIFEKYLLVDNDECTEERIGGIGSSGLS